MEVRSFPTLLWFIFSFQILCWKVFRVQSHGWDCTPVSGEWLVQSSPEVQSRCVPFTLTAICCFGFQTPTVYDPDQNAVLHLCGSFSYLTRLGVVLRLGVSGILRSRKETYAQFESAPFLKSWDESRSFEWECPISFLNDLDERWPFSNTLGVSGFTAQETRLHVCCILWRWAAANLVASGVLLIGDFICSAVRVEFVCKEASAPFSLTGSLDFPWGHLFHRLILSARTELERDVLPRHLSESSQTWASVLGCKLVIELRAKTTFLWQEYGNWNQMESRAAYWLIRLKSKSLAVNPPGSVPLGLAHICA